MELTTDQRDELTALMSTCAEAMFEDREWNAPVYLNGDIVGGNGTNAYEASNALDAVAQILGLDGPSGICDAMYGAADA